MRHELCQITISYHMIIDCKSYMISPRVYPYRPGYSLGLWGILWELPEYTLGYSLGAPRLYLGYSPDYTRV